ncbi:hypothetical protein ACQPZZ_01880 [Microbispora sp. CA-135349]|uniref:hypothetical protein n=1 Tax=Microbispora sp. CA-135349 TaxID=3239953 RepID=UPI003D928C9D
MTENPHSQQAISTVEGAASYLLAQHNENSTILQALGSIYVRETLPEHDIPQSDLMVVRNAWVEVPTIGSLINRLKWHGLAVLGGPSGRAKRTTAIKALVEIADERATTDSQPLALKQLTPDWYQVDRPQVVELPCDANRAYLLDVASEIDQWSNAADIAMALVSHGAKLKAKSSVLVIISTENGWPHSSGSLAQVFVSAKHRPSARQIAISHLTHIHQRADRAEWLKLAENGAPDGKYANLITQSTTPEDAVRLAGLLNSDSDEKSDLAGAIDAFREWASHLTAVFGAKSEDAVDERALLITAALFDGAAPLDIQSISRSLIGPSLAVDVKSILAAPELTTLLEKIGASVVDGRVSLSGRPGLNLATLKRVWRERPDLRQPLLNWIEEVTAPNQPGEAHLETLSKTLVDFAAEEDHIDLLGLAQKWTEAESASGDRHRLVATMLDAASQSPTLGPAVRSTLLKWSSAGPVELATVVALTCQGSFAREYPRQALVRLQWILRRPHHDEAVREAEKAIRTMAADATLLVNHVWPNITKWVSKDQLLSGRRAFLALVDPQSDDSSSLAALLAVAATNTKLMDAFVDAWKEVLKDATVEAHAQNVLAAWASGIAAGTLPEAPSLEILQRIVFSHLTSSPISALLYGAQHMDQDSSHDALVFLRQRLWQKLRQNNGTVEAAEQ